MSQKRLPQFRPGMTQADMSARRMQTQSDEVAKLRKGSFGTGLNSYSGPGGTTVTVSPPRTVGVLPALRFVAVVVEPEDGATTLFVREIVYAVDGVSYRWASDRIVAMPGYGYTMADFEGDVYSDISDEGASVLPVAETPWVVMHRRADGPPLLFKWGGAGGSTTKQFSIVEVRDETLVCAPINEEGIGDSDSRVLVYRPHLLRVHEQQYTAHGIIYVRISENTRKACTGVIGSFCDNEEIQSIVPPYRATDIIYATKPIVGGVDPYGDDEDYGSIAWLDDNRDGRAWAKKFGSDE